MRWMASMVAACAVSASATAQFGTVDEYVEISSISGGFTGELDNRDLMATVAALGDVNGDGVPDLAVGAPGDDDGGLGFNFIGTGAVWILFLGDDGEVRAHSKISETQGGFPVRLDDEDGFGSSVAAIGDLDGDGVTELAVGAPGVEAPSGEALGAVFILFLDTDGTVKRHVPIPAWPTFLAPMSVGFDFGRALAGVGDVDGDGVPDLAVGMPGDAKTAGTVWLLFLAADGTVKSHQQVAPGAGFPPATGDRFGAALAALGDRDLDGVPDLAVGSPRYDVPGSGTDGDQGAVTLLSLHSDGTVKSAQRIAPGESGFDGEIDDGDWFGYSVAAVGDVDLDGVPDLAVGAPDDDDGRGFPNGQQGAVWILFLAQDGAVLGHRKISATQGGFDDVLEDFDRFGTSLTALGDFDGDGAVDLAVGADGDDGDGPSASTNTGATYLLFLDFPVPPGTWTDLGGGLAGASGEPPLLTATGFVAPGETVQLRLQKGPSFAPVVLVVGLDQIDMPFKGGTLVPSPDTLVFGMTGPFIPGIETFAGQWVGNEPVVFQVWAADDGGPEGYVASNAVLGEPWQP